MPRAVALLAMLAGVAGRAAAEPPPPRTARVTYLAASLVYLDAGRLDGLTDSARVEVVRGGATIAVLRVAFLASHQASCNIESAATTVVVGDSARFIPVVLPSARDASALAGRPARAAATRSRSALRGRLGAEYFSLVQRDSLGTDLSQPSFNVRLDGPVVGALHLALDVRARRTYTILPDGSAVTDGRNRVYQGALSLGTGPGPLRLTLGRQISGDLASVGLFDGILVSRNGPRWNAGAFTGSQPEPLHLGYSSDIVEGGAYVQRHSRTGSATPWSVTVGVSGSYQDAHTNREFAYAQASLMSPKLSAFVTQEVDYYRPWKRQAGTAAISPTSTFATVQLRPVSLITLDAGFDNRRNVLLYRDVVNPETAFDDTYRQGVWGGVSVQPQRHLRLGIDARSSAGGTAGRADAYTATFAIDRVTPAGVSLRTRSTRYTNQDFSGWLHSGSITLEPTALVRLELNGGHRAERDAALGERAVRWVGAGLDLTLGRAWYLMGSATWQRGGLETQDQMYAGASWRF